MVAFSALKAGGFNPIFQNLHSAQINMFEALALGGYWIFLPENEQEDARDWQDWLLKNPIKDSGSYIKQRHYWGTAIFTSFITLNVVAFPILVLGALVDTLKNIKPRHTDTTR
jgi:hypothetical protein